MLPFRARFCHSTFTTTGVIPGCPPPPPPLPWRSLLSQRGGRWADHWGFSHPARWSCPPPAPALICWITFTAGEGGGSLSVLFRRLLFDSISRLDCSPSSWFPPQDQQNRRLFQSNHSRTGSNHRSAPPVFSAAVVKSEPCLGKNGQAPVNTPS